jgi:hypothetical protein
MSIQKPNIYLSLQANVQNKLQPADWVTFNFNLHSEEAEWTFDPSITKEEAFKPAMTSMIFTFVPLKATQ